MSDVTPDSQGRVRLSGTLTVDEVPEIYRQSLAWKDQGLPTSIELEGLELTDSSAVALLLEWAEWACQSDQDIEFRNPPEGLRTIAGLSNLEPLLDWEES